MQSKAQNNIKSTSLRELVKIQKVQPLWKKLPNCQKQQQLSESRIEINDQGNQKQNESETQSEIEFNIQLLNSRKTLGDRQKMYCYTSRDGYKKEQLNQFLREIQRKISESQQCSESEIMENLDIQWDESGNPSSEQILISRALTLTDPSPSPTRKCKSCSILSTLKSTTISISEFLTLLQTHSFPISQALSLQLSKIPVLATQLETSSARVVQLQQLVRQLQKNNASLLEDLCRIKKEVEIQVEIQEEKITYRYEKIIGDIKADFQRKLALLKFDASTVNTSSDSMCIEDVRTRGKQSTQDWCKKNNKQLYGIDSQDQVSSTQIIPLLSPKGMKKGIEDSTSTNPTNTSSSHSVQNNSTKIFPKNNKNFNSNNNANINANSSKIDQEINKINSNNKNSKQKSQSAFDKMVFQIFRPDRKESQSMKLPSSCSS